MIDFCLILFLAVASLWFFTREYSSCMELYLPACALKRKTFIFLSYSAALSAILLRGRTFYQGSEMLSMGLVPIDCQSVILLLLSSLIVLFFLNFFSLSGSVVYAVLGSYAAFLLNSGHGLAPVWNYIIPVSVSLCAAFVISFLIYRFFKHTLASSGIHLIQLSYYMRFATVLVILLTSIAAGVNWGGFVAGASDIISSSGTHLPLIFVITLLVMVLLSALSWESAEDNGHYSDFSVYTMLSVGLSAAVILLIVPVPVAVGPVMTAAIAGAALAQKSYLIEPQYYARELAALILTPLCSFFLSYIFLYMSGIADDGNLIGFAVMSSAIIMLAFILFSAYVRAQKLQREATDRIVYAQQQQIYENSRALNDMELKVIISENQALHNAVEMKRQEVMNVALSMMEQKEYLESLDAMVKQLATTSDERERDSLIAELGSSLKQRLSYDRDVDSQYFYAQAESIHEDFNAKLTENHPGLTQQERRLATLLRLGFSSKYIATLMNITPKSVEISRYRLRQKLGLSKGDNLVNFIKSI